MTLIEKRQRLEELENTLLRFSMQKYIQGLRYIFSRSFFHSTHSSRQLVSSYPNEQKIKHIHIQRVIPSSFHKIDYNVQVVQP